MTDRNRQLSKNGASRAPGEDEGTSKLWLWLHVHLRGRYWILVILAVLAGGGLGYLGYRLGKPTYKSIGQIQIVKPPSLMGERVDDVGDDDAYLMTQTALLKGRAVDIAQLGPKWQAVRKGTGPEALDAFKKAVTVEAEKRIISVSFEDGDPHAAQVGLKALIEAYQELAREQDAMQSGRRFTLLQQMETGLNQEIADLRTRIEEVAREHGTDDLNGIYASRRSAVDRLYQLLQEMNMRLALVPSGATTRAVEQNAEWTALLERLEHEELAQKDQLLRDLLAEKRQAERQLIDLTVAGFQGDHPRIKHLNLRIAQFGKDVDERAAKVRELLKRVKPTDLGVANLDAAELRQKVALVRDLYQKESENALRVGNQNLNLQKLKAEQQAKNDKLQDTREWMKKYYRHLEMGNKINVLSDGTLPWKPSTDTRPRFAAVGVVAGVFCSLGLVLLPTLFDRRFRAADETRITSYFGPVIGVLPELPQELADDENSAIAAHCVHQTRTMLQLRHNLQNGGQVLAITSSLAGTGKTSLALALGVSYATAGSRTLLIDLDLVGGGLTARVSKMMRRRLGQVLIREGAINREQLDAALARLTPRGPRLGEVCMRLGFVDQHHVDRAVRAQQEQQVGLPEALGGDDLETCVAETGFPGLHILPLGTASARHCASLSPAALRRLIAEARAEYDAVVIDTGPAPGSLEASVVMPQVDGVVMVVARGERRPTVAKSVEYVRQTGATIAGVVFNRAAAYDIEAGASTMHRSSNAFRSSSSSGIGLKVNAAQSRRSELLGPVARAVAGCAPSESEKSR